MLIDAQVKQRAKSRFLYWLLLALIVVGAAVLRLWHITTLPPGFYQDESFEGLGAWQILTNPHYRPIFLSGYANALALNSYLNAGMFWLFQAFGGEAGPVAMRVTAACLGVLGVAALYGLAAELQKLDKVRLSVWFPLLAAASLAVMRWHIHFSRIGIEPILVPLLWAGATWLFLRGWRTGEWLSFAGSGVLLALSMYAYQAAWAIPFLMIPTVLLLLGQPSVSNTGQAAPRGLARFLARLRTRQGAGLGLTVLVSLLCVLPFAFYLFAHPETVLLRTSQVVAPVVETNASPSSLKTSIELTTLMFAPWGKWGDGSVRRNIPGEPVLNLWQALCFFLGLGLAIWRIRRPGYLIPLIGLIGLLLPGALSGHAPHFHRTLGAAAPAALLCALGLDALGQWRPWRQAAGTAHSGWGAFLAGRLYWLSLFLLLLGGVTSANDYFVRWAALPRLYYVFDTGLWQIGQQLAQGSPAAQPVYLTPTDLNYPTLAFALRKQRSPLPIRFDGRHIFPLTAQPTAHPEFYVVIDDEESRTSRLLPEVFPNLTVKQTILDPSGKVYAHVYERPANTVPQRPPQHPLEAALGDGIKLLGYDAQPEEIHPGEVLYLQLHWLVEDQPTENWTVFTHVLAKDAAGNPKLMAGKDNPPGENSLPTTRWQPGWRVLDEYPIKLPADLPLGTYTLEIGLYQADGEHLPEQGSILLGKFQVK